jgi:hypothetical protein
MLLLYETLRPRTDRWREQPRIILAMVSYNAERKYPPRHPNRRCRPDLGMPDANVAINHAQDQRAQAE